ncbi:MAG TPA: hypothetical protein VGQ34_00285 [Sphingomicrobium sp.]|jgi:hypothetical protein|nr:hypothetical protein [Sphingomicrobium sp.]
MYKLSIVTAVLLIIPAPVLAQIVFEGDLTKFVPTKADRSKSDLDQVQCRMQDTTGTRLERHQVCLTKEQWLQYESEEKDFIQLIQARAAAPSSG